MTFPSRYVRAEYDAQQIASYCAMMRAYHIAGDEYSAKYTRERLTEYLQKLNDALNEQEASE